FCCDDLSPSWAVVATVPRPTSKCHIDFRNGRRPLAPILPLKVAGIRDVLLRQMLRRFPSRAEGGSRKGYGAPGPILPNWALQQVGSFLRYTVLPVPCEGSPDPQSTSNVSISRDGWARSGADAKRADLGERAG